jgi:hypothetical protein
MADAIYAICTYPSLYKYLQEEGLKEVDQITWKKLPSTSGNSTSRLFKIL